LLGIQSISILIVFFWTALFTFLICLFVDKTVGINIDSTIDLKGLDFVEHGEKAVNMLEYQKK